MGAVYQFEQISVILRTGDTLTFQDADYDYRYFKAHILGGYNDNTYVSVNGGASVKFGGTSVIDGPIYDFKVDSSGADGGALVFGEKSVRFIFGKYGSSSEGITP